MGLKTGEWVGKAEYITSDDGSDSVTMNDLIRKLGVSRDSIKSVFKGWYDPSGYKIEKGRSNACFLVSGVNRLGKLYNSGAIFRENYKGEILSLAQCHFSLRLPKGGDADSCKILA